MAGNWCAGSEYSQPPSYRGRALPRRPSARVPPPAAPAPLAGVVIDSIGVETFHDLKFVHEELVLPPAARKQSSDEGKSNLVTIVQTGDVTVEPVIVTVSGSATIANTEPVHTTEIDILAHL